MAYKIKLKSNVGPSFRHGKLIKPGSVISSDSRLDKLFPDKYEFLGEDEPKEGKPVETKEKAKSDYRLKPNGDGFDVIHVVTGAKLNDRPVSKVEARSLIDKE